MELLSEFNFIIPTEMQYLELKMFQIGKILLVTL